MNKTQPAVDMALHTTSRIVIVSIMVALLLSTNTNFWNTSWKDYALCTMCTLLGTCAIFLFSVRRWRRNGIVYAEDELSYLIGITAGILLLTFLGRQFLLPSPGWDTFILTILVEIDSFFAYWTLTLLTTKKEIRMRKPDGNLTY